MTTLKHTKSGKPILSLEELERGRKKETPEGARYECPLQDCPSIGKYGDVRKLYVNDRTGLWFCHYCKQGGQLKEYWALPTDSSIATRLNVAIAAVERERVTAQREQEKIAEAQSYFAQTIPLAGTASEKYLQSRGIDPDLAEKAGVRHANRWGQSIKWGGAPAVVFPGHNFHGQLVVTEGRYHRSQGDSMKAQSRGEKHLGVFHTPGAFEQRHIVIAEGPISALSLGMATIPAIAMFGSHPQQWLRERMVGKVLVVASDNDPAGEVAYSEACKLYKHYPLRIIRFRPWGEVNDWNDLLMTEGLDCFKMHLQEALTGTK